jgi:hypothetical protein
MSLQELEIFDPHLASEIRGALQSMPARRSHVSGDRIAVDILWAFGREANFGSAFAEGILQFLRAGRLEALQRYRELVRSKGDGSAAVGRLMALHLPAVLQCPDRRMPRRFLDTAAILEQTGDYTLQRPLEAVTALLDQGDSAAAAALLRLLTAVYSQKLSYSRSQHLALRLPRATLQMAPAARRRQLDQLARVAAHDQRLVDALLDGLGKGLHLLSGGALARFVTRALSASPEDRDRVERCLSLSLRQAREWAFELQVAVPLAQVRSQLNPYLRARTGLPLTVTSFSQADASGNEIGAYSDGRHIYLPERIDRFDQPAANRKLYRCLVRFESGYYEFDTFAFDCQRALERCRREATEDFPQEGVPCPLPPGTEPGGLSELALWYAHFPSARLAEDLFHVFEHGRIRRCFESRYPGLIRTYLPMLQQEWLDRFAAFGQPEPLNGLYAAVALALSPERVFSAAQLRSFAWIKPVLQRFEALTPDAVARPETAAVLAACTYALPLSRRESPESFFSSPLWIPFGRRLRPDLYYAANRAVEQRARALQQRLSARGIHLYRDTVRKYLHRSGDRLEPAVLAEMITEAHSNDPAQASVDIRELTAGIAAEFEVEDAAGSIDSDDGEPAWRYPEWNVDLGDYLQDHTRVRERREEAAASGQPDYYAAALDRHPGMVQTVRRAFEMLRPKGLKLYRRWMEGDEFDYRALIDYRVDRQARRTPSEKIYMKRVKEVRDVAVLLLVDLSRSTANFAFGSGDTVLDVEKEAIVLFTQALEAAGDDYAVAGFSGTGPLGVDYYRIKDFDEGIDDSVRRRIAAMTPRRNTRMGAAIRHAALRFSEVSSRVRLLILLGDGFPNDLDYKHDYAVADTRKAISELRAAGIYVHAITVNINADPRLDELYGDIHHSVISEVRELPDRMWRIYGALTR